MVTKVNKKLRNPETTIGKTIVSFTRGSLNFLENNVDALFFREALLGPPY